ncbi:MAG TPA: TMEM165/GDT1 family protein [Caulobacteraceae bacterium]|nr:TMEM165/GDT1 family protein [Caulobacteraceae bacterium]
MEPILLSAFVVALAEIGDRTQILAIVLTARFGKPWPVLAGILVATLLNHGLTATLGYFIANLIKGQWLNWVLAASFFATAVWTLFPDKDDDEQHHATRFDVFLATAVSFFIVEIGDKTQIATLSLAAKFHDIFRVAAGTTLGMMIANTPAVLLGEAAVKVVPLRYVRWTAAAIFFVLGVWTAVQALGLA